MIANKTINGLTSKTPLRLLLDAGAFFKNFDVKTDTFESAVIAKKLLGATKGGGSFSAVPAIRKIEIDGVRGSVKGLGVLDTWEVKIGANIVEVTADTLVSALGIADKTAGTDGSAGGGADLSGYDIITGRSHILDTDYIGNVTWVGTLSGSLKPVIIQVFNALNEKGLELSFEDKSEGVVETEFMGNFDFADPDNVPFVIYYPKETA